MPDITLYGFTYFLIHDVRFHHRPKNKYDFNNYGLLVIPGRYFK